MVESKLQEHGAMVYIEQQRGASRCIAAMHMKASM